MTPATPPAPMLAKLARELPVGAFSYEPKWDGFRCRTMGLDWTPLRPHLVCEIAFDQRDGPRLRNPARFIRWRPDRDASSCALDQLAGAAPRCPSRPS